MGAYLMPRLWDAAPPSSASPGTAAPSPAALTFLTWNTLADGCNNFAFARESDVAWSARLPLILHELAAVDADVIALQEVNRYDELAAALAPAYAVLFSPRITSAGSGALSRGAAPDGVALFVRRSRLSFVDVETLHFRDAATGGLASQNALVATLRDAATGRTLVVTNAHLKAGKGDGPDATRVSQSAQLVAAARGARVRAEAAARGAAPDDAGGGGASPVSSPRGAAAVPVVVLGDFNAPADSACVRNLLATLSPTGGARAAHADAEFTTLKYRGSPPTRVQHALDYCFFVEGGGLRLAATRRLPAPDAAGAEGLPNATFPSDHIPLAAVFEWDE
jgi:endonuclease/exonuclease/phosphatase family metal-dependent hydrolase